MPNADVILRSSDLVHFRVHKSVLVTSSPFFGVVFSLPQSPNDAAPGELPVVRLSEDAEVLNSFISMLYPVPFEMPRSSYNMLALLAAAAKYDMDAVQSSIRAEVSRRLLSSTRVEVLCVYAVAYNKRLIPEAVTAARLTLGYSLTFESLGDALQLFEDRALRVLADFRLRRIHNLSSNLRSFLDHLKGPSKIWVGCPTAKGENVIRRLPTWLQDCLRLDTILADRFSNSIPTSGQLCDRYLKALRSHVKGKDCRFCMKVHALKGEEFCAKMKNISAQAWSVPTPVLGERPSRIVNNS
jgi:hypothetical protein